MRILRFRRRSFPLKRNLIILQKIGVHLGIDAFRAARGGRLRPPRLRAVVVLLVPLVPYVVAEVDGVTDSFTIKLGSASPLRGVQPPAGGKVHCNKNWVYTRYKMSLRLIKSSGEKFAAPSCFFFSLWREGEKSPREEGGGKLASSPPNGDEHKN